MELINQLVQYGLAGVALYMMFHIATNGLDGIQKTLNRIEKLLVEIKEKLA